jgi:hypothetical protein
MLSFPFYIFVVASLDSVPKRLFFVIFGGVTRFLGETSGSDLKSASLPVSPMASLNQKMC